MKKLTTFLVFVMTIGIITTTNAQSSDTVNTAKIKMWPVPATDNYINVRITDPNASGKITTYNVQTKQLMVHNYHGGETLQISLLATNDKPAANAIYVTTFQSIDKKVFISGKFVKQ